MSPTKASTMTDTAGNSASNMTPARFDVSNAAYGFLLFVLVLAFLILIITFRGRLYNCVVRPIEFCLQMTTLGTIRAARRCCNRLCHLLASLRSIRPNPQPDNIELPDRGTDAAGGGEAEEEAGGEGGGGVAGNDGDGGGAGPATLEHDE